MREPMWTRTLGMALGMAALAGAGTLATGCDGAPPAPAVVDSGLTYYRDVKPIVDAHCTSCHNDGGIGGFALTSFAALKDALPRVKRVVSRREMPPWLPGPDSKPLSDNMSLADGDVATILDWIAGGAHEGARADEGPARPPVTGDLSHVDLTLKMPEPYLPGGTADGNDEYRCFVIPWPFATTKYVTGDRIRPGNRSIVHHAIGFLIDPGFAELVRGWDAADAAPGYRCYGGPTAESANQIPASFIATWSPGNQGRDRPAGTGILAKPGSLLVLQVHYNLDHQSSDAPDLTEVDLSLADHVEKRAYTIAWFDLNWFLSPDLMSIPAGKSAVEHNYSAQPTQAAGVTALTDGETFKNGMTLYSALPHMHTFGRRITLGIDRAAGDHDVLIDIPDWQFHWQREYGFVEPQQLAPGDKLSIDCQWDNSDSAQPFVDGRRAQPEDLAWGENSSDEMCIALIYVTPR